MPGDVRCITTPDGDGGQQSNKKRKGKAPVRSSKRLRGDAADGERLRDGRSSSESESDEDEDIHDPQRLRNGRATAKDHHGERAQSIEENGEDHDNNDSLGRLAESRRVGQRVNHATLGQTCSRCKQRGQRCIGEPGGFACDSCAAVRTKCSIAGPPGRKPRGHVTTNIQPLASAPKVISKKQPRHDLGLRSPISDPATASNHPRRNSPDASISRSAPLVPLLPALSRPFGESWPLFPGAPEIPDDASFRNAILKNALAVSADHPEGLEELGHALEMRGEAERTRLETISRTFFHDALVPLLRTETERQAELQAARAKRQRLLAETAAVDRHIEVLERAHTRTWNQVLGVSETVAANLEAEVNERDRTTAGLGGRVLAQVGGALRRRRNQPAESFAAAFARTAQQAERPYDAAGASSSRLTTSQMAGVPSAARFSRAAAPGPPVAALRDSHPVEVDKQSEDEEDELDSVHADREESRRYIRERHAHDRKPGDTRKRKFRDSI